MAEPGCYEWPSKPKIAVFILLCVTLATVAAEGGPGRQQDLTAVAQQLGVHPKASHELLLRLATVSKHWCKFQGCFAATAIVKALRLSAEAVSSQLCCNMLLML